jgi:beta-glucosidase
VLPSNGSYIKIPAGSHGESLPARTEIFDPSPPVRALAAAGNQVRFDPGVFPAIAAAMARDADVAVVFATRQEAEGTDVPDLTLPRGQDAVIEAVAEANPRTIVVLETGNPVAMPWLDKVAAVLAAWYPGQEGGQAIADVLYGAVDPSGRLPMSFPKRMDDFVRPTLPNLGVAVPAPVDYTEGAEVGYRWYHAQGRAPLFAFGFGLSYTRFDYDRIKVTGGETLEVSFSVHNAGARAGADVPQAYLTDAAGEKVLRLLGFQRVELVPGERREVVLRADPRLLGSFDERGRRWTIRGGKYRVKVGRSAQDLSLEGEADIKASHLVP